MINRPIQPSKKQSGAVLVVSVLLVFVSMVLGVTVLRSSIVESMIVSNEEIRQRTFHVAEAAALEAMATYNPSTLQSGDEEQVVVSSIDDRLKVVVTARKEGMLPIANTSLRLFGNYFYAIESTASNEDVSAERGVLAGVAQRIPLSQ